MEHSDPFRSTVDDTRVQMMRATYDALRTHGYSDLTIQRIGEEFPKSKSLIYQHYDGKDELLVDLLSFLLDHFESGFDGAESPGAPERLRAVLDRALAPTLEEEHASFTAAMTALRGQAPHDEAFRERFTETDPAFRAHLADVIRDGIDAGAFRDVDPEHVAELVVTTVHGAMLRRSTTDGAVDVEAVRAELDEYLRARLGLGADD